MKKIGWIGLVVILLSLAGCSENEATMTDREGNEVTIPTKIERIISTAPSNTEILIELGLGDQIVGVDTYSMMEGLNEDVVQLDFRNPDGETIVALEPDIIIASGHNKIGNEDPFAIIKEAGIAVVYIPSSNSIEGIYQDISFLAELTDKQEKGEEIIASMKEEIEAIVAVANTITDKKNVYFEIAPAPSIYTAGADTFQNNLIEIIGGTNIFADQTGWLSPSGEAIIEKNPDVIITNVDYMDNAVEEILNREGFEEVNAIREEQVFLIEANASSRPSQNVIKAIKEMAKAIYPEYYD